MDLVIVIFFGIVVTLIGIYGYKVSAKTAEDYLVAGRSLGIIVMLFFILFGVLSAFTLLAFPGSMYLQGPGFSYFGWGLVVGYAAILVIAGPRISTVSKLNRFLSPVELVGERFESRFVRISLAILLVVFLIPYIGIQPIATGLAMHAALGIPVVWGAVFMTVLMAVVVILGGMRSVAWVNVFLGSIFLVALFASLFGIINVALPEGLTGAAQSLARDNPAQLGIPGPLGIYGIPMVIGAFIAGVGCAGFPHIIISTMGARDIKVFKWLGILFLIVAGAIYIAVTIFGSLIAPVVAPGLIGGQADAILQVVVGQHLPGWMALCFLLAVIAASLSTAAVQLMGAGILISRDIVYVLKPNLGDQQFILWSRIIMLLLVIGSFIAALLFTDQIAFFVVIAAAGLFVWLPVLLLGVLWSGATRHGAIAGIVVGYGHLIAGYIHPPLHLIPFPVICIFTGMVAMVIVSLFTEKVSEETTARFFEEVDEYLEMESAASDDEAIAW